METVISGPVNLIWINFNTDCFSVLDEQDTVTETGHPRHTKQLKMNPVQRKVVWLVCTILNKYLEEIIHAFDSSFLICFLNQGAFKTILDGIGHSWELEVSCNKFKDRLTNNIVQEFYTNLVGKETPQHINKLLQTPTIYFKKNIERILQ